MRAILLLALLLPAPLLSQTITIGSGVTLGTNVTVGGTTGPPPSGGVSFTPPGGSYSSPQNVAITYAPGGSALATFYTTDGSTASAASTLFTSPITVSSSQTLNALVEQVGSVRQETQNLPVTNNSSGWKICTPNGGGPGTPASVKCGGVGSNQPSNWSVIPNTTVAGVSGVESISLSGTSGTPQILVTLGGSGCDSCTEIIQDKWIKPIDSDSGVMNHEHDAWHNDGTRNRLHMIGWQCNQQSAYLQWQYDNEQGSWQNTGIKDSCPLSTALWTHFRVHASWTIGDTGCGGLGCTNYDWFEVCQASSPNAGCVMRHYALNKQLENDNPGWGAGCADQDQVDLKSGTQTGGVLVAHNNVTCGFGSVATGSATYNF